jgi:hypothetical protein
MTPMLIFAMALAARVQASPAPAASPSPSAQVSPQVAPQSTTTPVPVPVPSASSSDAAPVPTDSPTYNFVWKPTPSTNSTPFPELGAPEILEIDVTDQTIAAPGPLHVRVLTSDTVVSVVAESFGYEFSLPKVGRGLFRFDGAIPVVPNTVKNKRFDVNVTATSQNGRILLLTLPFMLK